MLAGLRSRKIILWECRYEMASAMETAARIWDSDGIAL